MQSYEPMCKKYVLGSVVAIIGLVVMIFGAVGVVLGADSVPTAIYVGVAITTSGALLANATKPARQDRTDSGKR